jgi:diphosphomevalonate decarboxylase
LSAESKATALAAANIAFIKYWGIRDEERILPVNPSISMTLEACQSRCTAERLPGSETVEVLLADASGELSPAPDSFATGVRNQVGRLAEWAGEPVAMRIAAHNNFPTGAGLASSAAGFTALTVAVLGALDREVDARELSVLARMSGSGSAARSVLGGYVEWPAGDSDGEGHAVQLEPREHWDLRNVIAIVDPTPKSVSSRDGHRAAPSSPHYAPRQEQLPERLDIVRQAIESRDIELLGPVIEKDAVELHLVAMSSEPPIFYWQAGTLAVLEAARTLRGDGVQVYSTIDAGPNVHLICRPEDEEVVVERLESMDLVRDVIRDRVGSGPSLTDEHLF